MHGTEGGCAQLALPLFPGTSGRRLAREDQLDGLQGSIGQCPSDDGLSAKPYIPEKADSVRKGVRRAGLSPFLLFAYSVDSNPMRHNAF